MPFYEVKSAVPQSAVAICQEVLRPWFKAEDIKEVEINPLQISVADKMTLIRTLDVTLMPEWEVTWEEVVPPSAANCHTGDVAITTVVENVTLEEALVAVAQAWAKFVVHSRFDRYPQTVDTLDIISEQDGLYVV